MQKSLYPKFRTKSGRLTAYAFACGYIERKECRNVTLDLYMDGCFHVRAMDGCLRLFWECFETMSEARKFFDQQKKALFTVK